MKNFASRGGASEIPQTMNPLSQRKHQARAGVYGRKVTCLQPMSSPHGISTLPFERLKWKPILPPPRARQVRLQLLPNQVDRPQIILTSAVNLIQLQKQLKNVVEGNFEFRSTRNGTRVITKSLADFQSVKSLFDSQLLSYFTFFLKTEKPIKAVIRHLPINTPAEDISDRLVNLGFDVVSVKQMTTARWSSPEGPKITNLPPFPSYPAQDGKIPRNFLSAKPLPHRDQGRGIQGPEWPYAVSQLPAVQPRLGKLQTTSPLFMVRGQPPAQRVPREGEHSFHPSML